MSSLYQHIGNKIRERRRIHNKTMHSLASEIGISYQQLHKYERGINQIPLERLLRISNLLQTNFVDFLPANEASALYKSMGMSLPASFADPINSELIVLLKSLNSIKNDKVRNSCIQLLKVIALNELGRTISKEPSDRGAG